MARKETADETEGTVTESTATETTTESTESTEGAAAEDAGPDNRYVMIKDPETGEDVKRVDWIRKVFQAEGGPFYGDRGAIAKKLTALQGKKVPYQIVFAATKDLKHIKKPEPVAEGEGSVEGVGAEG